MFLPLFFFLLNTEVVAQLGNLANSLGRHSDIKMFLLI